MDSAVRLEPGAIAAIPCEPKGCPAGHSPCPVRGWLKHGISMPNAPGTIDADYRGEVKVLLINLGSEAFVVEPGMRTRKW